jgi:hypothetical protein
MRAFILTLMLAACSASALPQDDEALAADPRAWFGNATLSSEGLGAVRVGESIEPAQAALGFRLEQAEPVELSPGCGEFGVQLETNAWVSMLTQDGIVERISITGPTGIRTAEGIAVGDTAAQVRAAYPNAIRESAEYTPAPGHELIVWTDPENYIGLRFEIGEDERVTDIHAGGSLSNIEGCMTA